MEKHLQAFIGDAIDQALGAPGLSHLLEPVARERARRISRALTVAEAIADLPRENLEQWANSTPETMSLLLRVLVAAGLSGHDEVLKVLGGILADALEHPERSEEQEEIVAALAGLTRQKLMVLAACGQGSDETPAIAKRVHGQVSEAMVEPMLVDLFTRGFMQSPYGSYGGGTLWRLSSLGEAVKAAAERVRDS